MARKLLALLAVLALLILPAAALAESYNLVIDDAGLLNGDEIEALERKAWEVSRANNLEVVILTTRGTGGKPINLFAADFFETHGYGAGYNRDGVMLTLDMAERDWFIVTHGAAIRYYTDYGIQAIGGEIRPYLSNGSYYKAFDRYLDLAGRFAREAVEEQPFDTNHEFEAEPMTLTQKLGMSLPVGLVLSAISTLLRMSGLKKGMHTVKRKQGAGQYARKGSMNLTRNMDLFLYHTQHRERIPEPSSGGGGGGGSTTFHSSSGDTFGGGGGKF